MTLKVSIITPAFNRIDLLPETMKSVLDQGLKSLEYIVVDDGSRDGTWEWLQGVEDPRVKILSHPNRENLGQAAAINLGLSVAEGEYIVILDSDDLLADGALCAHADILDADSSLGMVYGQGYAINEASERLYPLFPDEHKEESDVNSLLLDCYIVSPGLCMFRKSVVDRVGLLESRFRAGQDHDFVVRVAEVSRIAYSPIVCFFYRKHDGSISAKGQLTRWTNGFEILHSAAKRYPYKRSTLRKRKAVLHFRLGHTYWRESVKLRAIRHLLMAGVMDPMRAVGVILGREKA